MELTDVSAIVTGGASGLGAATAQRIADAGAHVVIIDLQDEVGEETARTVGGTYIHADVTNPEEVAAAVETATGIAPLRATVNCAGIAPPAKTVDRDGKPHDLGIFQKVVAVNLVGTFNVIRIAAAAMAKNDLTEGGDRGAIVNTASVAAFDGQIGQVAYAASKAGVAGLTLPVARDLSTLHIRVNTIAPGIIDTPLLAGLPEAARESLAQQVLYPKRLGLPDEYAELVYLLLTHGYMNGEVIRMDGGIRMAPK